MVQKIRLHHKGLDVQQTIVQQYKAMDDIANMCDEHSDEAEWIRIAAALGLEQEDIEWALKMSYVNRKVDPAFVLGLLVLCGGTRDLINLDLLQDASYQEVMMDLCERITTDPEDEEKDAAFRSEVQGLIEAVKESQKEFNQAIKSFGTKQVGRTKPARDEINEQKFAEILDLNILAADYVFKHLIVDLIHHGSFLPIWYAFLFGRCLFPVDACTISGDL